MHFCITFFSCTYVIVNDYLNYNLFCFIIAACYSCLILIYLKKRETNVDKVTFSQCLQYSYHQLFIKKEQHIMEDSPC